MQDEEPEPPLTLAEISHVLGKNDFLEYREFAKTSRRFLEDEDQARLTELHRTTYPLKHLKGNCNRIWHSMSTQEQYHRITQFLIPGEFSKLNWRTEDFMRHDIAMHYVHPIIEPWRSLIEHLNRIMFNEATSEEARETTMVARNLGTYSKEKPLSHIIDTAIKHSFARKLNKAREEDYIFRMGQWVPDDDGEEEDPPNDYAEWEKNGELFFYNTLLQALTMPIEELKPMPIQLLLQLIEILIPMRDEVYKQFKTMCPHANEIEEKQIARMIDGTFDAAVVYGIKGYDKFDVKSDNISHVFEVTEELETTMHEAVSYFSERIGGNLEFTKKIEEINKRVSKKVAQGATPNKSKGKGPAKNRAASMAELETHSSVYVAPEVVADAHSSFASSSVVDPPLDENSGKTKKKNHKKKGTKDGLGGKKRASTRRRKSRKAK